MKLMSLVDLYNSYYYAYKLISTKDEIFGSAYASAVYLKYNLKFPQDKKVFVVGMKGLEEELQSENIKYIGGTDPSFNSLDANLDFGYIKQNLDPDVGAVMCGFDILINYKKLCYAYSYLTSKEHENVKFLLTNDDSTFPQSSGLFPGKVPVLEITGDGIFTHC